jgi:hypothetical protein
MENEIKGKGTFPRNGRNTNPRGKRGRKKQGDPLYSPQKIKDLTKNKDFNFQN